MGQNTIERTALPSPRYEYGGDDHVFVELDQAMSFDANFEAMAVTKQIRERDIDGVVEICPSNASYMIRLDPDVLHPDEAISELQTIEDETDIADYQWDTRVIDIPVLYDDPWTHETLMRFRDRHQDPEGTDLDYSARINGFDSAEAFIDAHSGAPHMVTMMGFVPGLPFALQMVPRDEQVEVPKYLQPRTDTPSRAIGFGGAFSCVYPVQGAGGYQLFGRTPVEVLDVEQELPDFQDSLVFLDPGDIIKFRQIDRQEYDEIREEIKDGTFEYTYEHVEVSPEEFFEDPHGYNAELLEVLG